jgi:phosphatidylserine decarboxylase
MAGKRDIQITDYSNQIPAVQLPLGGELGRFRLGSTAIVLFQHGAMKFESSLEATSSVAMGQLLGQVASAHE